jgi:hypothetical protein|nr:MAG TPA: hypothetical protein [Caudoviricetes sp.]
MVQLKGWLHMNDSIYRRFIPIGTPEEMDRLKSLMEEKSLSREDLKLILETIKLNPDISW